jgi:hypothetical protein
MKSLFTHSLQSFHLLSLLKIECPLSVAASLILTAKLMMCIENPALTVRGGRGVGFEVAVGQQGGAATRIAPHLPGFTSVRG